MRLLAFALLFAIVSAGTVSAQSDITEALAAGDAHYAAFDNVAAISDYEAARSLASDDFEVLWRLTRTYNDLAQDQMAEGDSRVAEETFGIAVAFGEQLVDAYPNRPESHFFLAAAMGQLALFKGGRDKVRFGQAVDASINRAIELDPSYPLSYIALGIYYREISELNWVQRTLAKALFGGVPDGSKEDAVEMLNKAIELDPTLTTAHFELGKTYAMMRQRDKAKSHFEQMLALAPNTTADVRSQEWVRELLADWQ